MKQQYDTQYGAKSDAKNSAKKVTSKGAIIFLNGVSSSGKTSLANELLTRLSEFFRFSVDDFDLVIDRMEDRDSGHLIPVETDELFHETVALFSNHGINLIVDQVLHCPFTADNCLKVLRAHPVLFVGVHCPLNELERREKERSDRTIGQAKTQLQYVHKHEVYDVEVNTYRDSLADCANKIIAALEAGHYPDGWLKTQQKLALAGFCD